MPIRHDGAAGHLDTMCAVVDTDAVVMHPSVAYSLTALTISPRPEGLRVSRPQPFLEAAALAMGIDRLRVIDTGLDPAGAGGSGTTAAMCWPSGRGLPSVRSGTRDQCPA